MKSPKGVISESIAEALATYFVIDPSHVETNLIKNAGVTLHDVELQPITQQINPETAVDITGTVREAGFYWKWGSSQKDGGSNFVNSAKLSIAGLDFRAVLRPNKLDPNEVIKNEVAAKHKNAKKAAAKKGMFQQYVEDQVERIIDTLTLTIEDFKFKIQIDQSALIFGGQTIRLESEGRMTDNGVLKQTLTIDGIFGNVVEYISGNTETYPLMAPFSYTTSCVRTGGKRFGAGIATGLEIQGPSEALLKEFEKTSSIVLHAGTNQLEFLNTLGGYLLTATTPTAEDESSDEETPTSSSTNTTTNTAGDDKHLKTSFMNLPLKGLVFVFPNGSKISVQGLLLQYFFDGTMLKVSGHEGFSVNDELLLDLPASCQWEGDVVNSKFRVYSEDSSLDTVATIRARETELQKVKDGMLELVSILQGMTKQDSGAAYEVMSSSESAKTATTKHEEKKEELANETDKSGKKSSPAWTVDLAGGVDFSFLDANEKLAADCTFHNVKADAGTMTFSLEVIDKAIVPGALRLKEPLKNTTMSFDGSLLDVHVGDIIACLEDPPESQKPGNEEEELEKMKIEHAEKKKQSSPLSSQSSMDSMGSDDSSSGFTLPFAAKVSIKSISVYETNGTTLHTTIKTLDLAVGPDVKAQEVMVPTGGIRTLLVMEEFHHKMIQAVDPKVTAVVRLEDLDTIESFDFSATSIGVAAGYSVLSWKRLFETGDQNRNKKEAPKGEKKTKKKATKMPFACVHPLKINVAVNKGKMINLVGTEGSTLHFSEFRGKETTTSDDLIAFYSKNMISNVPGVVANANVLGFDLADSAAGHVGIAAGAGTLSALGGAAAPVAGVLGIIGLDGIRGTIDAGKRGRGASSDDKAQFGDFFRGFGQSIAEAAQGGAKSRGKAADQKADALDWAVGATSNLGSYTEKNKSRLGGAGAGTVGFAYGMLLGGPVGAVAGAVIASKGTSATIDTLDNKFKRKHTQRVTIDNGSNANQKTA